MAVAAWLGFPLGRSPLGSLPRRRLPVFAGDLRNPRFLTLGAARQVAAKGFRIGTAPMPTLWAAGALRTPGDRSTVAEPGRPHPSSVRGVDARSSGPLGDFDLGELSPPLEDGVNGRAWAHREGRRPVCSERRPSVVPQVVV